jgi:hypothetical protein
MDSDTYATGDDLSSERDDIVSEINSLADEQEEKRNNMPEQLQDSGSGETLQNRYDSLQEWASNLEGVDCDVDDITDESSEVEKEAHTERLQEIIEELQSYSYDGE